MAYGDVTSTSSQEATGTTTHEVALPTLANNDFLIVSFAVSGSTADVATTPTGWTLVERHAVLLRNMYLFTRRADGTEGATLTVTTSASVTSSHCAMAVEKAKLNTEAPDDSDTGGTTMTAGAFAAESSPDPYLVLVAYCNWGGTETISTWPTSFTLGRQDETLASNSSSICATALVATTGIAKSHTKGGSSQWLAAAISLIEDTSSPPPTRFISATTSATCSGTATERKTLDVTSSTSAAVLILGQGETTPNPPDGLPELLDIYAQTDAFCQVIQEVAGNTTITVATSATVLGRASPVDSLKHMAAGTSARATVTGSPVVAAAMTVSTDASATASTQLGEPNANCCCITPRNDCGSVVTITHRGPTASLTGLPVPNDDGSGNGIVATLGVFVAEPGEYRLYEVGSDGSDTLLYATKTFPVLDGWSDPSISSRTRGYFVENGKTLRAEYLGDNGCRTDTTCVIYPWVSEYECDRIWYSDPELYQGPAGASGCFGLDELNAWSTFSPTVSVQVSGLTGPMAALNGVYSGRPNVSDGFSDECDYEYLGRVCWVPDEGGFHWAEGFVLFKVSSFQQGAASVRVGTNHSWWTFGPPPLPVDCGTWLPPANITAGGYKQEYRDFNTLLANFATKYASCSIECDLDPSVRLSRRTGKVFQGLGDIQAESSGECFFSGFGLDLIADHCFSAAEFTWL